MRPKRNGAGTYAIGDRFVNPLCPVAVVVGTGVD